MTTTNCDVTVQGDCPGEKLATQSTYPATLFAAHQVISILGAQWGDEGKGKLVDVFANFADICCRFNGGNNAGHSLVVGNRRVALHLVPCGILSRDAINLIGHGVVVHVQSLFQELERLREHDPEAPSRVLLSSRAHLVFDFHLHVDRFQESEKQADGTPIGTTRKGIGPCYSSKMARSGLRVHDLVAWTDFEPRYRRLLAGYQRQFGFEFDADEEIARHREYSKVLKPMVVDGVAWLHQKIVQEKKRVLVEGANAALLDIDFGTYPCVTSSSTTVGGICTGLGIPPGQIKHVIGVAKAYTTRVGFGPFVTELTGETLARFQQRGSEFGTTTGRARRCGWLDIVVLRYSCAINGYNEICLTKLDVLTGTPVLKVCTHYRSKRDGTNLGYLTIPLGAQDFQDIEPVYLELPGWTESLDQISSFEQLPRQAQNFVLRMEELIGCPIRSIGVGAERHQMIYR